jgi:Protein of unknown function (DUF3106)
MCRPIRKGQEQESAARAAIASDGQEMRANLMTGWGPVAAWAAAMLLVSPCAAQHWNYHPVQQRHPAEAQNRPGPARQGGHAGDWLRRHKDMSPEERQRALENDPGFRRLPPQQQQQLRQRLQRFSSLPPQQQQRMLDRMEIWEHLTPEQKQQARQIHGRMLQLPPERRRLVNTAVNDLRAMPPAQREQIINSDRFKSMFSPEERDIMRGAAKLPLAPPEGSTPE